MGSLSELQLPSIELPIPGAESTLTLRGLSITDAASLLKRHGETLEVVYQQNIVGQEDIPPAAQIAKALMQSAPLAVAEIIALANGSPDMVDAAQTLPAPVQVEALASIAVLTFHSEAEVKKLVETVILGSGVLTSLLGSLGTP